MRPVPTEEEMEEWAAKQNRDAVITAIFCATLVIGYIVYLILVKPGACNG